MKRYRANHDLNTFDILLIAYVGYEFGVSLARWFPALFNIH